MMPPSPPLGLTVSNCGAVSFSRPLYTGGGNIQDYEVIPPQFQNSQPYYFRFIFKMNAQMSGIGCVLFQSRLCHLLLTFQRTYWKVQVGLLFCVCVPGILQDGGLAQNRWQYFLMVNTSHLKNIKIKLADLKRSNISIINKYIIIIFFKELNQTFKVLNHSCISIYFY